MSVKVRTNRSYREAGVTLCVFPDDYWRFELNLWRVSIVFGGNLPKHEKESAPCERS